ncbi:MAG: hypothetical protein V7603_5047 [Micromonosporaceae bacterium]
MSCRPPRPTMTTWSPELYFAHDHEQDASIQVLPIAADPAAHGRG